uniref:Metallo-beta-lactamase domain-containing protein n=1 Tax=Globodera rostochiensis TaxID=31243 RepID=A0A914H1V2_GLORO
MQHVPSLWLKRKCSKKILMEKHLDSKSLCARGISPNEITHLVITHWHLDHCGNIGLFPTAQLITPERIMAEGSEAINNHLPKRISVHLYGGHSTPGDVVVRVKQMENQADKIMTRTIAIVGDLFEFENDWLFDQPWKQNSFCPSRQLISRFLCWKGADEIIPGHGPSFRLTTAFHEKSAIFGLVHENDAEMIGTASVCELFSFFAGQQQHKYTIYLIKCIGGETVLVNTGGPGQDQRLIGALDAHRIVPDDVKYLVITNLGIQFCYNLHLFKNAKTVMFNDIAFPGSYYDSLNHYFSINSEISVWRDMDPICETGTLSVLVKRRPKNFTVIGSKLDEFIPAFLDLTEDDIEMAKVVLHPKDERGAHK